MHPLTQLWPLPTAEVNLPGLYLGHDLRQVARQTGAPFFFSNFVVSLDGRIATPQTPGAARLDVPAAIANPRDWRLFQELVAQTDLILMSGRFFRDWADGRGHEILQTDDPRYADLADWRARQGLPGQPDIGVISRGLEIRRPAAFHVGGRQLWVFAPADPAPARVVQVEAQGGRVVAAGAQQVVGVTLVQRIQEMGYQVIFSATGPQVVHLLLEARALNRLYLTYAQRVLAGGSYQTAVEGAMLQPPYDFNLHSLYYDPHGLEGVGQLFAAYDRSHPSISP